ncbi:hypothetical protein PENTCL1PPCAC_27602, partial [Pristionchus entomophagus]
MQLSIVLVDFCWGFLYCPVLLLPLTAVICEGFICSTDICRQIGIVLLFQCMIQVALMLTYTLHYKHLTIAKMTNHRQKGEKIAVRTFHWIVSELPVIGIIVYGASRQNLHDFLEDSDTSLNGIAFSITRYRWIPILFVIGIIGSMLTTVSGCAYFVVQTLKMLSTEVRSLT